jgi:hypothetical protein
MDTLISGLGKRVFLLNNVHEDGPVVFQTRWALSYLRGPLSREQIQRLMAPRKQVAKPQSVNEGLATMASGAGSPGAAAGRIDSTQRPVLPPDIPEFFLLLRNSVRKNSVADSSLYYRPALIGTARVHFTQSKTRVDVWESLTLLAPLGESLPATIWDDAQVSKGEQPELEKSPAPEERRFAPLPGDLTRPKKFASLTNSLKDRLYRTQELRLWKSTAPSQISQPGESEQEFRLRLSQGTREVRDADVEKARAKNAPKLAALQERIRKAQQKVEKEQSQASQQKVQAFVSFGSSVLAALTGRKLASAANVNRAAGALRAAGRVSRETQDVVQATDNVQQLQEQYVELEAECKAEVDKKRESISPDKLALEEIILKPKKADISVTLVALVWVPDEP